MSRSGLIPSERLAEFFSARNVAIVGAKDSSGWARWVHDGVRRFNPSSVVVPVNPNRQRVFDLPVAKRLADIDTPIDLAFLTVPAPAVEEVILSSLDTDIHNFVVVASGYGEGGEEGRRAQERLAEIAHAHGKLILGPNSIGYLNTLTRSAPLATQIPAPIQAGHVGLVLQSGALTRYVLDFSRGRGIGLSHVVTVGNEAAMGLSDVLNYLVDEPEVRSIGIFLETVDDADRFATVAHRAALQGKAIVALTAGRSEVGRAVAAGHTGGVAGESATTSAALRQLGIIEVGSLEELMTTASMFAATRSIPRGRRVGVVSSSGGACDLIADRADDLRIDLPPFDAGTVARLDALLPDYVTVRNPLDISGFAQDDRGKLTRHPLEQALECVLEGDAFDAVLYTLMMPDGEGEEAEALEKRLRDLSAQIEAASVPVILATTVCIDLTDSQRRLFPKYGVQALGGLELGVQSLGHLLTWAESVQEVAREHAGFTAVPAPVGTPTPRVLAEDEGRELLRQHGVPVAPGAVVESAQQAQALLAELDGPVVMKICSAEIPHKSDVGGVLLGISGAADVASGFERLRTVSLRELGEEPRVLVAAMRPAGVELLVSVRIDAVFGRVLTIGLGGVLVELLGDVSLRVLPVRPDQVIEMLRELKGFPLLAGHRGTEPVDLHAVADAVLAIARAAEGLGSALELLEVNPLWARGDQVEALDVLVHLADTPAPDAPTLTED